MLDFIPAVKTKPTDSRFPAAKEMAQADTNGPSVSGGPVFSEDSAAHNRYAAAHNQPMSDVEMQQGPNPAYANQEMMDTPRDSYASSSRPIVDEQPQMYPTRAF